MCATNPARQGDLGHPGNNTTIESIEFSGASVVDGTARVSGRRGESYRAALLFSRQRGGILAGDNASSEILIEYSEFARCDSGTDSPTTFTSPCEAFHPRSPTSITRRWGTTVKSRAYETYLFYNRISDEGDGTASRNIDLPNGGFAVILGNVIHHGPRTENSNAIEFGLEGLTNPDRSIFIAGNTIVSERSGSLREHPVTASTR